MKELRTHKRWGTFAVSNEKREEEMYRIASQSAHVPNARTGYLFSMLSALGGFCVVVSLLCCAFDSIYTRRVVVHIHFVHTINSIQRTTVRFILRILAACKSVL